MTPLDRARTSLEGLSIGDAFGETFFGDLNQILPRIGSRTLPEHVWPYTDDTEMALSIVEHLAARGEIEQDDLAERFARRMQPSRGYGKGAFAILDGVRRGKHWRTLARDGFNGMGSFGNGAAMRVAPLGAYFADREVDFIAEQAKLSSEVTHAHAEGIAGGIAVAIAAALAQRSAGSRAPLGRAFVETVRDHTPAGYTRDAIAEVLAVSSDADALVAARALGNGSGVTAPDTVPFCLWVASRFSHDFVEAMWNTVTALGDRDTTCAIVGGIVICQTGRGAIPEEWLEYREPIELETQ
ncbi:MAG TPA: ADP-ribosylglycohydrolase family protein [Polyangiaceae bacterium]|nr:ADP-ribosylglycohydrolase family protein [Polyangiaceae bacterium]